MVVSSILIGNKRTGAVSIKIVLQIVSLRGHILAHLIEGRGRNEVALAIHLPGDGIEWRADLITTRSTSSGASVDGHISAFPLRLIENHAREEIRIVVVFVVDNSECLRLNSDTRRDILTSKALNGFGRKVAEDTIIKGCLILPGRVAIARRRVGPMDLVCLPHSHTNAPLPIVRSRELWVLLIVVAALVANTALVELNRTTAFLVVLSLRVMLRAKVPVHVHRAQAFLAVG
mmetsp:Transcript_38914/g.117032  ORF Transcript_38914/g.117032 Transcript_38914/m.117032 type:complete len:232 (+) Transcript_38914:189-884(+)